jgi:hypothetical protein
MKGFTGITILPLSAGICLAVALANEFSGAPFTLLMASTASGVTLPYKRGQNAPYLSSIVPQKGYPAIPEKKTA